MKRFISVAACLLAMTIFVSARQNTAQQGSESATLKVTVHYTGSNAVDDSHNLYVVLWDTPDFLTPGSHTIPIQVQPVTDKNGTATFTEVAKSPVYVSTVLDPKGTWEAQSPPPAGSSLGLYSKEPGKPAPVDVKPGKPAAITMSFDDTHKMS